MNRAEFIKEMDESLKLVRTEYGLTQDKMAGCIGLCIYFCISFRNP